MKRRSFLAGLLAAPIAARAAALPALIKDTPAVAVKRAAGMYLVRSGTGSYWSFVDVDGVERVRMGAW